MIEKIKKENAELFEAAYEWILDGWEYAGKREDITPLMVAAALEKEANTQDESVKEGVSHPSFPIHLRRLAALIAKAEAKRLSSGCYNGDTLCFDDVISRIEVCLQHRSEQELADFHNNFCDEMLPIRYDGDSIFTLLQDKNQ